MSTAATAPVALVAFCERNFPSIFFNPFEEDRTEVARGIERLIVNPGTIEAFSIDRGRGVTSLIVAGALYASLQVQVSPVAILTTRDADEIGSATLFCFYQFWGENGPPFKFWFGQRNKAWLFDSKLECLSTGRLIHVIPNRRRQYQPWPRNEVHLHRPKFVLMDNPDPELGPKTAKRLTECGASVLILNNHDNRPEAVRDGNPPRPSTPGHG